MKIKLNDKFKKKGKVNSFQARYRFAWYPIIIGNKLIFLEKYIVVYQYKMIFVRDGLIQDPYETFIYKDFSSNWKMIKRWVVVRKFARI